MNSLTLITTKHFREASDNNNLTESFISAMENMDILKLEELLTEDAIFENKGKWEFLTEFRNRFNHIRQLGFSKLYRGTAYCNVCIKGSEVISFKNESGGIHFGLALKKEEDKISEIIDCRAFEGYFRSLIHEQSTEFANYPKIIG